MNKLPLRELQSHRKKRRYNEYRKRGKFKNINGINESIKSLIIIDKQAKISCFFRKWNRGGEKAQPLKCLLQFWISDSVSFVRSAEPGFICIHVLNQRQFCPVLGFISYGNATYLSTKGDYSPNIFLSENQNAERCATVNVSYKDMGYNFVPQPQVC